MPPEIAALEGAACDARCLATKAIRESVRARRAIDEFSVLQQQFEKLASQSSGATQNFIALAKSTKKETADILGAVNEMAKLCAQVTD